MRISHKGNAKSTTLTAELSPTGLTFYIADATGWPDGGVGPFYVTVNKGTALEEKILCSGRAGLAVAVWTLLSDTGRAQDDTTAQTHPAVTSTVEHTWTAVEADAANAHIEATTAAHGFAGSFADIATKSGGEVLSNKTIESPTITAPVSLHSSLIMIDSVAPDLTGADMIIANNGGVVSLSVDSTNTHASSSLAVDIDGTPKLTVNPTGTTVVSPTATGSNGVRQITISTSDPSGGSDGDVWMKYTP
jgi:hypothetical protein